MREMKDSNTLWCDKIPQNWDTRRVKYIAICLCKGNGITKEDIVANGDTPCVRYGEIYTKYDQSFYECATRTNKAIISSKQYFTQGDILFAGTGELIEEIGKNIVYLGTGDCLAGGDIIILKHKQNARYLNYALNSEYVQAQKSCNKAKLKVVHISTFEIGNIRVAIPALSEQQKIADFLDRECGKIDGLKADIQAQIDTLEQYKRSVITEAVTHGLNPSALMKDSGIPWVGEIPEYWNVNRAKYCFVNTKEIAGCRSDRYERLALTMNGVIKRSKDDSNGLQPEKFETYQILRPDELVFKLIDLQNVSTSRVGLSPYLGLVSPAYIILKSNKRVLPAFAEKYFLMLWKNQIFNALGDAGVRSNLNSKDLLELSIPLPPIDEQQEIADYLDNKCAAIEQIIADKKSQIETLDGYKKSLIYEYVTGKKEVV